jgi:hypothetical protein
MSFTREQQELLETYGFDLMAQIEGMLRHVREYQRALQQLRGTLPRSSGQTPSATMQKHISALREAMKEFDTSIGEIETHASAVPNIPTQATDGSQPDGTDGSP